MLLRQGRIPGPLFVGDNLQDPWAANQFEVSGATDLLKSVDPLQPMIEAMYQAHGPARFETLWSILSFEQYARWLASYALMSSTAADNFHNHLLYLGPRLGLLEPLVVDAGGHGTGHWWRGIRHIREGFSPDPTIPINEPREPLKDVALRDPRLYHRRNVILYDALMATASTEPQHEILDAVFEKIYPDVYADRRKRANRGTFAGPYRIPYSNRRYDDEKRLIYKWIVDRNRFLMDQLRTTTVSVEIDDRDGGLMFVVGVEGHSGASFDTTEIGAPLLGDTTFDGQPDTRFSGTMILYPGLEEESEYVHRRVTNFRIPPHFLKPGKQSYLFGVDRSAIEDLHGRLAGAFSNAVTGDRIEPQILFLERDGGAIAYNEVSLHAWKIPEPPSDDVILGPGKVVLEETLEIGAHQRLIVRAGTELLLGPASASPRAARSE